jgi:hypothetical protein
MSTVKDENISVLEEKIIPQNNRWWNLLNNFCTNASGNTDVKRSNCSSPYCYHICTICHHIKLYNFVSSPTRLRRNIVTLCLGSICDGFCQVFEGMSLSSYILLDTDIFFRLYVKNTQRLITWFCFHHMKIWNLICCIHYIKLISIHWLILTNRREAISKNISVYVS